MQHPQVRQPARTYNIHPTSATLIQRGHPWVTLDSYSERFPKAERFIIARGTTKPQALLLHDPDHKHVRARVWATDGNFQKQLKNFSVDLAIRVKESLLKREDADYTKQRNHYYLIFGEADSIPGAMVSYLNGEILIQFYMSFWTQYQEYFITCFRKSYKEIHKKDIKLKNIWVQYRTNSKSPAICADKKTEFKELEVEEFGVKYKIVLGRSYDHGIYTDMASIRMRLKDKIESSKSFLNLFSYTGAFSLFAMKLGVEKVVSVDLSKQYITWLEENIALNDNLDETKHKVKVIATIKALKSYKRDEESFDFIISDPPSSSSDGKKRTNSLDDYKETLPLMFDITNKGGSVLIFLNTHRTPMKKFEEKIKQIIVTNKLNFIVEGKYNLAQDCPNKKGYPEGSYLKGILLRKK